MPSRQDQLSSHQYAVRRVVGALVARDPDPPQAPPARSAGAVLAGLLIAAILVGGAAAYGAVVGSARTDWRDQGAVIVERETGARYVYRDGTLHPVLNYSSAVLIVGVAQPRTVLVRRAALRHVERGVPLGIPDAPDSMPPAADLMATPWTACSTDSSPTAVPSDSSPTTVPSAAVPSAAVLIGGQPPGGSALGSEALLARSTDGSLQVIWQGHRHVIREPDLVLSALGWTHQRPVSVADEILRTLPAGVDLARPAVPGHGSRSSAVPRATIGEVMVVVTQGGRRQYAVALRDGLAVISQVQADLLLTAFDQDAPTNLSQGRFRALPRLADLIPDGPLAPPEHTPELRQWVNGTFCVRVAAADVRARILIDVALPAALRPTTPPAPRPPGPGTGGAGHVQLPPGSGVLVQPVGDTGDAGPVTLVTDAGRRYAVPDPSGLTIFGYATAVPVRLPVELVELIPPGPALDRRSVGLAG
ncbi:type VII secretion protein EccB [Solwaraspora sp. WMMB335]|uniref:type VII secretion protein EccB n=1 Tax=Solwaraspora sp. WMMB335 TaxID=3404118 RepID=UPI003B94D640